MRTRQDRRNSAERAKRKAKQRLDRTWGAEAHSAAMVGKNAATHGTCDCWMCAPRGYFGRELTRQELRNVPIDALLEELL